MTKLLLITVAGGLGSLLRYVVSGWGQRLTNGPFPAGTLVVNVVGSLALGFAVAASAGRLMVREEYRIGLTVGLLGGFTTFSTFGYETFALINDGQFVRAGLNVVLNVGLSVASAWFGYRVAETWLGV